MRCERKFFRKLNYKYAYQHVKKIDHKSIIIITIVINKIIFYQGTVVTFSNVMTAPTALPGA